MAFKLKSGNSTPFKLMGSSPVKQKVDHEAQHTVIEGKTYPKGYTKKDIKFLKEQREDVVRYEDLDAKGKAIRDAQRAKKLKGTGVIMDAEEKKRMSESKRKYIEKKKKSPAKQKEGFPKSFNITGSSASDTPGYKDTKMAKAAKKAQGVLPGKGWGLSTKAPKTPKAPKATTKFVKGLKKAGKFAGGKTLGVAGMMMATSSKADQPTKGKGKIEYPGGKIDFTKKNKK
mgnify:CR=1 FL=1